MPVTSRVFLAFGVAVAALALVAGGGCTKRGVMLPSPTPPAAQTLYVNPVTGNDTTGNGSSPKPYKTLTRAVKALPTNEPFTDTIDLAPGHYTASGGETFPIKISTGVTIQGNNYGTGVKAGVFIDGLGEDTAYENLGGSKKKSLYDTLEVLTVASVTLSDVYVGSSSLAVPAGGAYVSTDVLGTVSASASTFGAGFPKGRSGNGIIVPSGSLTCNNCVVNGTAYAIAAQSLPQASATPGVTLSGQPGQGVILGTGIGILSDASATVTVSGIGFSNQSYVYADTLAPLAGVTVVAGIVDFGASGYCGNGSTGGNSLIGAKVSEIYLSAANASVCAYNDTWNPGVQNADPHGKYKKVYHFTSTSKDQPGQNVSVATTATGSSVTVGPYVSPTTPPTATPTPNGSSSPSPSPSASPTPG